MIAAFDRAFAACPLIAILRGVKPAEVVKIGEALVSAGFNLIEVPLNSPDPFDSIARLAERFSGTNIVVGAGTVLDVGDVSRIEKAGGSLVIAPNMNPDVIAAAKKSGLVPIPGIFTPSEAFAALAAGAAALKLFPAEGSSPAMLKAMRAVLPDAVRVLPVGGIAPQNLKPWLEAGAAGFGLGSALYASGLDADEVRDRALDFVEAWGGG